MIESIAKILEIANSDARVMALVGVIAVLVFLLALFISIILMSKSHDIKKRYFAEQMDFIEEKLAQITDCSTKRLFREVDRRWETHKCPVGETNCDYLRNTPEQQKIIGKKIIADNVEDRTLLRIKNELYRGRIYRIADSKVEEYKREFGSSLLFKNRRAIDGGEFNNYDLIRDTHDVRYSKEEAIEKFGEIVDKCRELNRIQKKETATLIFSIFDVIGAVKKVFSR